MAGFKGGLSGSKKMKFIPKNALNKGGVIGSKQARVEAAKR